MPLPDIRPRRARDVLRHVAASDGHPMADAPTLLDPIAAVSDDLTRRIQAMVGSDVADEMIDALRAVGGTGRRRDLISTAIDRHGWSAAEQAVPARRRQPAQPTHLRLVYDDAVDVCQHRGWIESTGVPGYWRLTEAANVPASTATVEPHPFGHVYLASVGVTGAPVDDTYDPATFSHLWFAKPAAKVFRRGHVFIVGVGLKGAILGLYRIDSAGTTKQVPHPTDAERWPWSLAVTPLASVRVSDATPVSGVKAPQGNLVRAQPQQLDELYAAVAPFALPAPAGQAPKDDGPPFPELDEVVRTARPFDPDRPPIPAGTDAPDATWIEAAEALALQEKARQGHHRILARLARRLAAEGWTDIGEIPGSVDLWATAPGGPRVIFEAKTLREENEVAQSRSGLAQLLEYRHQHGRPQDEICLVTDPELDPHRSAMLHAIGVAVLTVEADRWRSGNHRAWELGLGRV